MTNQSEQLIRRKLFDFYLDLLANPQFKLQHQFLYASVLDACAKELLEDSETTQGIFERMAREG